MRSLCILLLCLFRIQCAVIEERIVGGTETVITEFPYQLSLHEDGQFICGASLIRSNWALTAAHCTKQFDKKILSIRAGSTYANSGGQVVQVKNTFVHPKFDEFTLDYDVCLMQLQSNVNANDAEAIDVISSDATLKIGEVGVITGWGSISEKGPLADKLETAEVMVVDHADCVKNFTGQLISDNMFCAGVPGDSKDACQGDSGGPFVINSTILAGIISWGEGCALPGYPGVYTNLAVLADFVEKTLTENQ